MTKYKITSYSRNITPVEILKESPKQVTLMTKYFGGRHHIESKETETTFYGDTWEECKDWAMRKAERKVSELRRELEKANADLGNIKGWKPPTP